MTRLVVIIAAAGCAGEPQPDPADSSAPASDSPLIDSDAPADTGAGDSAPIDSQTLDTAPPDTGPSPFALELGEQITCVAPAERADLGAFEAWTSEEWELQARGRDHRLG